MKKFALFLVLSSLFSSGLLAQPVLKEVITSNVSCNGFADGSALIRISGGASPYTYTIFYEGFFYTASNIIDTFYTFNNVEARTWNVLVEDSNNDGFSLFKAATVKQPSPISITGVSIVPITCTGAADAEILVTAVGESGSFKFELNPAGLQTATGNFSPLGPGTYTVTVTDANGCLSSDVTDPLLISNPALISILSESRTNASCYQADNGTISVSAGGGTPPFSYTLNPGAAESNGTGNFSGISPGDYTVEVTDANNCLPATSSLLTITEPDELVISSATVTGVTCNGNDDGTIVVTVSGGIAPYLFTLSPGNISNNTGTFSGLGAGSYTVGVTDANTCGPVLTSSLTVEQPEAVSIVSVSYDDISCNGAGDGEIRVTAAGGTAPLSYTLNPGSVTQATGTFSNLAAGSYTITVNDSKGCPPAITSPITIVNPVPVSITGETFKNISCNGAADGSISITATGGTGILNYTLNPGSISNTGGSFTGLGAGSYTVTVEDENACPSVTTKTIKITEPGPLSAVLLPSSKLVLDCFGDNKGSINVNINGGTTPYVIRWTGPGGYTSSVRNIKDLRAGTYRLNVTDAGSCKLSPPLEVTITAPPAISVFLAKTDLSCFGDTDGTISVTAFGGTPGYQYSLDGTTWQASNVFIGLIQNTYTVYVRDAKLCTATGTIQITAPDEILISNETVVNNNKCYGDSLGEIRISGVEGGALPYGYSIDGGVSFHSTSVFLNLPAGSYQTVVRDASGCTSNGKLNQITQPALITISSYNQTNVTGCFGNSNGLIYIEATGGTGTKYYSLDGKPAVTMGLFNSVGGGTHRIRIGDSNQCIRDTFVTLLQPAEIVFTSVNIVNITTCAGDLSGEVSFTAGGGTGVLQYAIDDGAFGPSGTFSGLPGGVHTLWARDGNNCLKDTSISISEPPALVILTETATDALCAGSDDGSIAVAASGGKTPYTYTLLPDGTTVNNGLFSGLAPGDYTVEVNDVNGCGPVTSSLLTISEPTPISIDSITLKEITCSGADNAEIRIYPSGGIPPYQVSIDNGINYASITEFTGLTPGTYRIFIRDANDCILPADTLVFIDPPALGLITETKTDITTCFGDPAGEIIFEVSGGTGSIEYSIDNGVTWQVSGTFPGLSVGNYTVIARDASACTISSALISILQPPAITADFISTPAIDVENMGTITISNASGGTGILEFSVNGTAGPFSTETAYTELEAGVYEVVIRDENGCMYEENVIVDQIIPLEVTITVNHITCFGYNDGSISINAGNATGQAEFSINGGSSWSATSLFGSLGPGNYDVWVRDEDDRYFSVNIIINEPAELNIFRNVAPATCNAFSADGAIDITLTGASGTVNYQWSNGATTEDLENIEAGNYQLTATDENLCSITDNIFVPAITTVIANAGADTSVCYGDELYLDGQGGSSLSWMPAEGLSNPNIGNPLVETTRDAVYILRAVGMNDCYNLDTVQISVFPRLGLNAGNDTTVVEFQTVVIVTTGGPYLSYQWEPATGIDDPTSPSPEIGIFQTTTYIVSAETDQGCTDRDTITIKLAERLIVYNAFSPNYDGVNDYWDIDYAWLYPDITVEVFNRWGERLFSTKGYTDNKRWDGKYKGRDVPLGTYYYVIVPYPGASALTGPVTVVR